MPVSANRVSCTYLQQSSICGRFTSLTLGVTAMPQKLIDDFQRDSSPQATKACVGKDVHDIVERLEQVGAGTKQRAVFFLLLS